MISYTDIHLADPNWQESRNYTEETLLAYIDMIMAGENPRKALYDFIERQHNHGFRMGVSYVQGKLIAALGLRGV